MARSSGRRKVHFGMERQAKRKGRVRRHTIPIPTTGVMRTITLTPLNPKTGLPIPKRIKVVERRKVRKGNHSLWRCLLLDENRIFRMGEVYYLREIIA